MKAHIGNTWSHTENSIAIIDNEIYGRLFHDENGLAGCVLFNGTIDLVCDADSRDFELKDVVINNTFLAAPHGKYPPSKLSPEDYAVVRSRFLETELMPTVTEFTIKAINDHKEYLLDNHHDFDVMAGGDFAKMKFHNTGVDGDTFLAIKADEQEQLESEGRESQVEGYCVEFSAEFELEFTDDSKTDVAMKDFTLTHIEAKDMIGGDDEGMIGGDNEVVTVTLSDDKKAELSQRVIAVINKHYVETKGYVIKALGGADSEKN